jgi:palmitoyltransferase
MRSRRIRNKNRISITTAENPEVENIFKLVSEEKIVELTEYILNEKNEIWNVKRVDDLTVLHNACAIDKTKMVETIIEQTKKRLKLNSESILSPAERENNETIFKDFINAKTLGDNQTALHYASFRGNMKIIKLLIENHADINALTLGGYNMLHKAAQGNKPSAIIYFNKKYNMDLYATEEDNMNALHIASFNGMDNSVIYLLSLGINPNVRDKNGFTALHYAVKKQHIRIIKKLLQKGADRNIKDNKSKKIPIMYAKNNPEIVQIFRQKGICEKLFFKPDITQRTFCSNKNMILFIVLHLLIIALVFFIVLPFLDSTAFSIGYLAVSGLVFILYFTLSFSNPGIMANKTYKDLLDVVEKGEDLENFCPYCIVKKKYKSLHCLVCQKCVDEFDHHCFWVGNCVGKNNYTLFFIFLIYVLLNTLFNVVLNIFFLATELASRTEIEYIMNNCFPGFYFGDKAFVYEKVFRIIVSSCIFIICVLFFVPLFNLFRMQLSTACEKRQLRREEEEYERNQLREKLDEEVWEDLVYEGDDNESESDLVELDVKNDDKNIDERPLLES